MHVKILWIVEEIDTELFCFEGLDGGIFHSHLRSQQLQSNPLQHISIKAKQIVKIRITYPVNDCAQCPPLLPLWHKSHSLPSARRSQSHRLRLSRRINRGPFINKILDQFRTTQPNKICRRALGPKYIAILISPFCQSPGKLGLQMNECMIDNWRSGNKRR